jgi:hypothetical protein
MAHFAKLDENNIVIEIFVVSNEVLLKEDGTESEEKGIKFLNETFGYHKWVQTSIHSNFRKNYAKKGDYYNEHKDAFIAPKPYNSFIFNEEICRWENPVPHPNDGQAYEWNEESLSWVEI